MPHPDLDTARLLEEGQSELTSYYASTWELVPEGGEWNPRTRTQRSLHEQFGFRYGIGTSSRSDMRIRYEMTSPSTSSGIAYHYIEFSPKFELARDVSAFSLPWGMFFTEGRFVAGELRPMFIQTLPIARQLELSFAESVSLFLPAAFGGVKLSIGAGIGPDVSTWAIRPEIGVLLHPYLPVRVVYAVGVSFYPRVGAR